MVYETGVRGGNAFDYASLFRLAHELVIFLWGNELGGP